MTEAQKKAVEVQKEIEEACIRHGLNLTIFENGIGFVDPKENKIVMVWRPQYKPETPSLRPMEENTQTDFKPATQKPSGGNMSAFIFSTFFIAVPSHDFTHIRCWAAVPEWSFNIYCRSIPILRIY